MSILIKCVDAAMSLVVKAISGVSGEVTEETADVDVPSVPAGQSLSATETTADVSTSVA